MAFDLDDEELKATREMPCHKINYKFEKEDLKSEIKKAMVYIESIDFMNYTQKRENQKKINRAYLKLESIVKEIERGESK